MNAAAVCGSVSVCEVSVVVLTFAKMMSTWLGVSRPSWTADTERNDNRERERRDIAKRWRRKCEGEVCVR